MSLSQRIIFTRSQGTLGKGEQATVRPHGFDFVIAGFLISLGFLSIFHSQADFMTLMRGTNEVSASRFFTALLLLHGVCPLLRFLARSRSFANQAEVAFVSVSST